MYMQIYKQNASHVEMSKNIFLLFLSVLEAPQYNISFTLIAR